MSVKYDFTPREEVQAFVPADASRILDIGCSRGAFGESIKRVRGCEVWGVELDAEAAADAEQRLDRVVMGDAVEFVQNCDTRFDCVTCNDVLEHMVDPGELLRVIPGVLSDKGCVVASIPNIRYFKALRDILFRADFPYQDDGIFDRTHLRFFTRKSMIRLFQENGYEIVRIEGINRKRNPITMLINLLFLNRAWDLHYLQFVVVARPDASLNRTK